MINSLTKLFVKKESFNNLYFDITVRKKKRQTNEFILFKDNVTERIHVDTLYYSNKLGIKAITMTLTYSVWLKF